MADESKPILKDDFKLEYAKSARSSVSTFLFISVIFDFHVYCSVNIVKVR
jgi:hypothetical protein